MTFIDRLITTASLQAIRSTFTIDRAGSFSLQIGRLWDGTAEHQQGLKYPTEFISTYLNSKPTASRIAVQDPLSCADSQVRAPAFPILLSLPSQ